jgi:hypothetical protein
MCNKFYCASTIPSIRGPIPKNASFQADDYPSGQRSKKPVCHSFQRRTEGGSILVLASSVAASSRITSAGRRVSSIAEVSLEEPARSAEMESTEGMV